MAVSGRDMQFVVVGIKQLDPVLRAFRERHAMPNLLARAGSTRFAAARPARDFELGPPRREPRIIEAVFDFDHDISGSREALRNSNGHQRRWFPSALWKWKPPNGKSGLTPQS